MKQLYPPADVEVEPVVEDTSGRKPAPFGKRRPSHGALFGGPAEKPPKGKVRQLYPPAPFAETAPADAPDRVPFASERDAEARVEIRGFDEAETPFETIVTSAPEPWLEPEFERDANPANNAAERNDSLFVSSEEELEERRRRARERAEQRRLGDLEE
jgi:hypothetical protein